MTTGEAVVNITDEILSLSAASSLIESLISNFLYSRGQIEKPVDQLRQSREPVIQTKLQYAERSTPYQSKGNYLFATPLDLNHYHKEEPNRDTEVLTDLVTGLSLQEAKCSSHKNLNHDSIPDTPLTSRNSSDPIQRRRVLGKLQEVSVPITPQLNYKQTKSRSSNEYLLEILDQVHNHIISGWNIEQVIILIGSTIMSPRETYVIDLSCLTRAEDGVDDDKGKLIRRVMQCLFIDPFLSDLPPPLSPTNCHVVLKVDKENVAAHPSSFFVPRLQFYLSKRGSRFVLKINNSDIAPLEKDTIYMASPKPFKAVYCSSPVKSSKPSVKTPAPRDFLDTINL